MGQNLSWPEQIGHRLDQQGAQRWRATTKTEVFTSASQSKAEAKPKKNLQLLVHLQGSYPSRKNMDWYWTRSSIRSSLPSGKKNNHSSSTRRTTSRLRWGDRILETERLFSEQIWGLSIFVWWCMEEQDDRRRRQQQELQYCADSSGQEILYLRALLGHSGRNPIDRLLQDNEMIPNNFCEYIYQIGCAVNLHSITHSGLIPGGQNSSRDRQTVFLTAVNPMQ